MKISVRTMVLAAAAVIGAALPVAAQEVSAGYQFQRLSAGGGGANYPLGFAADVSRPIGETKIAVVGQFDWSRKSVGAVRTNVSLFGGGARWTRMSNPAMMPFLEGLVGLAHTKVNTVSSSSNDLALQVGGGLSGPVTDAADWLMQVDYRCIFANVTNTNSVRVVLGVRLLLQK